MNGSVLQYITGPVIGAVIGCFTNYLAVRMLFRPYNQIKIGNIALPFTPGIIPKRHNDISRAIGIAVGKSLFTGNDLQKILLSDTVRQKVSDLLFKEAGLAGGIESKDIPTVTGLAQKVMWDDRIEQIKYEVSGFLADSIIDAVKQKDVERIILEKGTEAVQTSKAAMGFAGLFLKESTVRPVLERVYIGLVDYLEKEEQNVLVPVIRTRVDSLAETPVNKLVNEGNARKLRIAFDKLYNDAMSDMITKFKDEFNIAQVVEDKVRAMDVAELERLCLSVMQKELNAIVWLGAILGFLMGILNVFF